MTKVTFILDKMGIGGVEISLLRLLRNMDRSGLDIHIILMTSGGVLEKEFPKDVRVEYAETLQIPDLMKHFRFIELVSGLYNRIRIRRAKTLDKDGFYNYKVRKFPDSINADCVICYHNNCYIGFSAAAESKSKRKIYWIHSTFNANIDRDFFAAGLKNYDVICCVSDELKKEFDIYFPEFADKSLVVYNLADADEIRRKAKEESPFVFKPFSLLTVARLYREKGLHVIPAVTKILLDRGYNINWYIIGEGQTEKLIRSEIQKYGVEENVFLLGSESNPFPYMKKCDIYVQPSVEEGFGLTVQEAKILHKPIVASDIPAFREQITDGVDGLLTDLDPESIAEKISRLIDDEELTERIKQNLQQYRVDNKRELEKVYSCIKG